MRTIRVTSLTWASAEELATHRRLYRGLNDDVYIVWRTRVVRVRALQQQA